MKGVPENPMEVELQQEKEAAYFAACRKMVDALEALGRCDTSGRNREQARRRVELLEEAGAGLFRADPA